MKTDTPPVTKNRPQPVIPAEATNYPTDDAVSQQSKVGEAPPPVMKLMKMQDTKHQYYPKPQHQTFLLMNHKSTEPPTINQPC